MSSFVDGEQYSVRDDLKMRVNYPKRWLRRNIETAIRRPLPQVQGHAANDYEGVLLCGGPSLIKHWNDVAQMRRDGAKVFTVNATHEEALDRDIVPSAHVMMDARRHNIRFVERPQKACRYLLCNQVHPDVFDALSEYDVHIWHCANNGFERGILDEYYLGRWEPILGGTSVGTRAIWLTYVLGIRTLHVFGLDGCLAKDGSHHAYNQPENDFDTVLDVKIGRRTFSMHAWMVKQLDEWIQFLNVLPPEFKLNLHGDGAIQYLTAQVVKSGKVPKCEVIEARRAA